MPDDVRIVWDSSAQAEIDRAVDRMLDGLLDDIAADAKRGAPVDTGRLRAGIENLGVQDGTGRVGTTGIDYGVYVEKGTRRAPAQPFLRPALYQRRGQ